MNKFCRLDLPPVGSRLGITDDGVDLVVPAVVHESLSTPRPEVCTISFASAVISSICRRSVLYVHLLTRHTYAKSAQPGPFWVYWKELVIAPLQGFYLVPIHEGRHEGAHKPMGPRSKQWFSASTQAHRPLEFSCSQSATQEPSG